MTTSFDPESWATQARALLVDERLERIARVFSRLRVEPVLLYEPSTLTRFGFEEGSKGRAMAIAVRRRSNRRARRALKAEGWELISFFRGGASYWRDGISLDLYWSLRPLKRGRARRMTREMRRLGSVRTHTLIEPPIWLVGMLLAVGLEGAELSRAQRKKAAATVLTSTESRDRVWRLARGLKLSDELDHLINSEDDDELRTAPGSNWRMRRMGALVRRMRLRLYDRPFHPFSCEFLGMRLYLGPSVFHPQPSAEKVAEIAIALLRDVESPIVVDVGTGSGAVALAVARALPDSAVHAVDVDRSAVRCARRNGRRLGLDNVSVSRGHLLDPVAQLGGRIDVVAGILPYLPRGIAATSGELAPVVTLDGGSDDGLGLVTELANSASQLLRRGGWLIVQVAESQWDQLVGELDRLGYVASEVAVRWPGRVVIGMAQRPGGEYLASSS